MNFKDISNNLFNGERVRRAEWDAGAYIYIDLDSIRTEEGNLLHHLRVESILAPDWEVYNANDN